MAKKNTGQPERFDESGRDARKPVMVRDAVSAFSAQPPTDAVARQIEIARELIERDKEILAALAK